MVHDVLLARVDIFMQVSAFDVLRKGYVIGAARRPADSRPV
jgi:hypothetical protein